MRIHQLGPGNAIQERRQARGVAAVTGDKNAEPTTLSSQASHQVAVGRHADAHHVQADAAQMGDGLAQQLVFVAHRRIGQQDDAPSPLTGYRSQKRRLCLQKSRMQRRAPVGAQAAHPTAGITQGGRRYALKISLPEQALVVEGHDIEPITRFQFTQGGGQRFLSLHQWPLYPGTGRESETGAGNIRNVPMPAGSGDAEYLAAFDSTVLPWLEERRPDVVLVSAGFDAHARDPLASQELSSEAFGEFTQKLCRWPVLSLLEGGYDLVALETAVRCHLEALQRGGR